MIPMRVNGTNFYLSDRLTKALKIWQTTEI